MNNSSFNRNFSWKKIITFFLSFIYACSIVKSPIVQSPKDLTTEPSINSTATATATLEKPDIKDGNQSCWIAQPFSNNLVLGGGVIFYDFRAKVLQDLDFASLDIETFQNSRWVNTGWVNTDIAANGNMIADFEPSLQKIRIITENLDRIYSLPDKSYFYDGILANGQIRLNIETALQRNYQNGIGATDEFLILSPDTGETKFHSLFLPFYGYQIVVETLTYSMVQICSTHSILLIINKNLPIYC